MRPRVDLALYLVTDHRQPFEAMRATVLAAVRGGATMVQLRNPDLGGRALLEQAVALKAALAGTGVPLLVNDRTDVAHAAGADGVHVGQSDLPAAAARAILGPDAVVGLSITEPAQLAGDLDGAEYLGVGPVFATGTKADAAPALGLDGLAAIAAAARGLPTVAIGGIDLGNAPAVMATGVGGLSVVSAISCAADPEAAARALREAARR